MDMRLSLVLALMVAGFFPLLSICAWQTRPAAYTEGGATLIAVHYLKNSPTFRFDGIPDSVRVDGVETLRCPWTWEVTIAFECRHAGYGDRTGMMLAQVITPHEIHVVIQRGEVIRAVIDGRWDELKRGYLVQSELGPPEFARDAAIEYVLQKHGGLGGVRTPASWETRDITPPGLVGSSTQQYIGDGWTVNVSYPMVLSPTYAVEIDYEGNVSFRWRGTVDQGGDVEELEYVRIR